MKTLALLAFALAACAHPAPRAPIVLPDGASSSDTTPRETSAVIRSSRAVIMSMRDVEPYDRVPASSPAPPPSIELAAPLTGALAGAAMGLVLGHGYTLATEHRWADHRKADRDRLTHGLLYGAGLGLAAGTYVLVNSLAERATHRRR